MHDRRYPAGRNRMALGSVLLAALAAMLALLALQGCASRDLASSDAAAASGNGTMNDQLRLHMGVSENSYASLNAGNRH